MDHPFEMWGDRLAAADTDEARRALLVDARVFRARHLGDVVSARRATFAVSRLHLELGEREEAVHEARQLLSLCQTAPAASAEELEAARAHLAGLGEKVPRIVSPPKERSWKERPPREGRGERPQREPKAAAEPRAGRPVGGAAERDQGLSAAREAAVAGRWDQVVERVGRPQSPQGMVLLALAEVSRFLEVGGDPAPLVRLQRQLAASAGLRAPARPSAPAEEDDLARLLGAPVPDKRAPRIRLIEDFADSHPERIDELAAAALRHHARAVGVRVPAPWLVGTVARAVATGRAPETQAAIAELRAQEAIAVQAYDEWPFDRLVRLVARASARGLLVASLRRGVLAGGNEPDQRKVWTLRLRSGEGERMVAVAPHAAEPYPAGKAEELARRLHDLCPSTLLLATGSGNDALRAGALSAGCRVLDRDADDDRVLDLLLELPPVAESLARGGERPAEVAESSPEPRAAAPEAPRGPRLSDLLAAEPFDPVALRAAVAEGKRPERALRSARGDLADDRLAELLRAVAECTPADRPILEGISLALRSGGERSLAVIAEFPQYSGPGLPLALEVARGVAAGGWEVHRVLRGPTLRETERHPALGTLASGLGGLWRLLVRRDERRGEVWVVADLPVEGRAGVPLLLLEPWPRVVALPDDEAVAGWWSTLGSTPGHRWPQGSTELLGAMEAFPARAAEGAEEARGDA